MRLFAQRAFAILSAVAALAPAAASAADLPHHFAVFVALSKGWVKTRSAMSSSWYL
jgi:hypothetical protein